TDFGSAGCNGGSGATLDIGQLVSNFALALSTTVVGLAVRIVINTFQSELPGLRKLMQNELDQAAIELTRNARNISLRLESVNEEIQTTFSESLRTASQGVQQSSETVEQQSQQALQGLVDAVDNAGKAMQQTVDEFRGRISAIHLPEDLLTETIGAPLERLGLRLDEVQKGLQQLAQQQTRTADDWGQAGKGVARLNTQLQLSEKAQLKLLQLVQQMMQYSDQVQQAVESMAQQSGHAQQTSAALDAMVAQVQPLSQQMATSMEQLQKSSALLHPLMQTMQQDLTAGQQVSGDMNHLAEGFADHSAQLLQSMQNNQQQLQQQLQEYQQTLAAVSGHFVEAARYVSERLKE
ncbi:MAG: hypothetical protein KZQ58_05570, partial [gamma proteobacterium symbiont of Bathyaustriella thionipta]|nr:hypothetical protein [gamma proteobacterium symbiont of Bathyaustriella thionipta]